MAFDSCTDVVLALLRALGYSTNRAREGRLLIEKASERLADKQRFLCTLVRFALMESDADGGIQGET